jgi:carboxyl-terminal processing protease
MNIGFPDVCLTPAAPSPVPIPYPNFAMNAQASVFSETVKISMMNALNLASEIPVTSGDEPGSASPNKGPGRYTMGNPIVSVDALPAINLLCPTTGNGMINGLGAVLVPSAVNVFFCDRDPGAAGASLGDVEIVAPGVGRVAIARFALDLSARVHGAVERLRAEGMTSLVIDLRGCPGGDAHAALALADDFLDRGALLAFEIDAEGDRFERRARGGDPYRFPVALLVDERTASAAELFAGSLRAHRRAVVVGATTYGKGTAQALVAGDGPSRYDTVLAYALPDGVLIEGRGVAPDRFATDALRVAVDVLKGVAP